MRTRVVRQFANPTGPLGHVAGWVMGHRSSNLRRNRWAVELLEVGAEDRVLELGFGPGVAIAALAARASRGHVVGVDRSPVMLAQARRRNARAVRSGLVELHLGTVEDLPDLGDPFDRALAVNNVGFWDEPDASLRKLRQLLRPDGVIGLVSQPRCPGATAQTTARAGDELAALLRDAGFAGVRLETLGLTPPVICALASNPA